MESYDPTKATRVWQRVQSGLQQPDPDALRALMQEQLQNAAAYRHLAKSLPQKQFQILRQLARDAQSDADCLNGICTIRTGTHTPQMTPPLQKEPAERMLRKCYGREMRCLAEYDARTSDPEYGPVFAGLAARKKSHCMKLLELMGQAKT